MKNRLYGVVQSYQSPYPDSIFFQKGEQILIGKDFLDDPDWKDWVWCESKSGSQAWIPLNHLQAIVAKKEHI